MSKPGTALLVHWDEGEAETYARPLREAGWHVHIESSSGSDAFGYAKKSRPDMAVIYATRLPSHGISVARELRGHSLTSRIPIVFVDQPGGASRLDDSVSPDARCTTDDDLVAVLAEIPEFLS
jgi:DNA-binding response OmpR family regulator